MAKKALVLMADGCEEIETVTIIDILRRAGVEVAAAGLSEAPVVGSRKIRLIPDVALEQVRAEDFDAVVVPGGLMGVDQLRADKRVLDLLKKATQRKTLIGAICAAPLALKDAGVIQGRKLTSYPGIKSRLNGVHYSEEEVVIDGNLVTSRAPGTAMKFALALVKILAGEAKAKEVAEQVLAG